MYIIYKLSLDSLWQIFYRHPRIAFWEKWLSPTYRSYPWWREHDRTCVSLRTQGRSVAASISNSKIHRYGHTENNSVYAHQLYDDKSRISKARAAYPSTSGRDTRVLRPVGIPYGGTTALHSRCRCSTASPKDLGCRDPATPTKSPS